MCCVKTPAASVRAGDTSNVSPAPVPPRNLECDWHLPASSARSPRARGALTQQWRSPQPQVTRLRAHAINRDESRWVATALEEGGTKEVWLFSGGFWWDLGYEAARRELGYDNAGWPPIEDTEAVLRFLAFQPVVAVGSRQRRGCRGYYAQVRAG